MKRSYLLSIFTFVLVLLPKLSTAQKIIEDFEDTSVFPPFSIGGITEDEHWGKLGEWTVYDGNGLENPVNIPSDDYENKHAIKAWQVFNPELAGASDKYAAYSGNQYLASFCVRAEETDHWLISPLLSGRGQNVSFYMRSSSRERQEIFEILYSKTDTDTSSFVRIATYQPSTAEWLKVEEPLPAGAKHFAIRHKSNQGFGLFVDHFSYEPDLNYGITIGDVDVTNANYTNISSANGFDAVKSGSVSFDPQTNTLSLKDAQIVQDKNRNATIIFKSGENDKQFNLVIEGNNEVKAIGAAMTTYKSLSISRAGTLKLLAEEDCGLFVASTDATLTISECQLEASGEWGISGRYGTNEKLIINKANVSAVGSIGSICDFKEITLNECEIVSPVGAYIDGGIVKLNGEVCTDKVVINYSVPNSVNNVDASSSFQRKGIYTLSGVKLDTNFESLPQGIYIVDGEKITK